MEFRSATTADIDAIADLWAAAGLGGGADIDRAEIAERLASDDGFFVVTEVDGAVIGAAMGCYDNHRGWVKRVAVDPDRTGTGIGRALVRELEDRFLAAGISKLRLAVWGHNEAGLAFWRNLDYVELPEIHYFSKDLLGEPDDGC